MSSPSTTALVRTVLDDYGRTYAGEMGIRLEDRPAPLFQLLVGALLLSARIPAGNAVEAASALIDAGLTTPEKMAGATWQERVGVITWHGYKRYDERTSTMLGETAELLLDRYGGDLRRLREEAGHDPAAEKRLVKAFKGIDDVGADIFLREVQAVWDELYPYVDGRVGKAAESIGLPGDAKGLAGLVDREDFPRFVAGLVRIDLGKEREVVLQKAGD